MLFSAFTLVEKFSVRTAILLALLAAANLAHAGKGDLSVGACQRDISPISPGLQEAYEDRFGEARPVNHSDPVFMAGFGTGREATDYNDRIWARGVVIDGRGGRIALVSLDLIGYFNNQVDIIREMVGDDIDYLIVHSSHSHEGPDTLGIWGPDTFTSGVDPMYLDFVNDAVADCIAEASASMTKARVKSSTIQSDGLSLGIGVNDDGFGVADQVVLEGDLLVSLETEGRIVDPNLVILQFTERGGKARAPIATIVNFGSHPEVLWSNNTVLTSDFPHYVRERLEQEYGGIAIWTSGALGVLQGPDRIDVSEDGVNPVVKRSFEFARVHGEQLAERAIEALDKKPGHPAPVIAYSQQKPLPIRLDNPYFRFFFAIGVLGNGRTLFTDGQPDTSVGTLPPPFDAIPQALGEDLQTEAGVARVGDAGLIVVPTEVDPQIAVQYRDAFSSVENKLVIGLANDEIGYQLQPEKFDNSCFACAGFVLSGQPERCPLFPNIDCGTVFQNNVGVDVDPVISGAVLQATQEVNESKP